MSQAQIETMIDFSVAQLVETEKGYRSLAYDLAKGWPDSSGFQLIFVIVSAANILQQIQQEEVRDLMECANAAMHVAALIGVDLYALELRQKGRLCSAGDLIEYWQTHDAFFIEGTDDHAPDSIS